MRYLVAMAGLAAMAACSQQGAAPSYQEAGAVVDSGNFGNATMNNHLVMKGEKKFVLDLSERFAEEVDSTVNFAFDSAQLSPQARATLRRQARWIKQFPEVRFRVYGHTDKVGSQAYNKRLGLRRARVVVNYLVSEGIGRHRLEAVASFGETQPLIVTQGRERRNRRTVTEVSGFVESHPVVMDGKYAEVVYREYVKSAQPTSELSMVGDEGTLTGGGGGG
jgi:outer membrane protein OmpA-like peptidoglycan-associated protein